MGNRTHQVQLTEMYARSQQSRSDVREPSERGQVIADDDLVVVLGPSRRGCQEYGAAQRVRHQVHLLVIAVFVHVIDHGRHVVVTPFVDTKHTKCHIQIVCAQHCSALEFLRTRKR